MGYCDTRCRVLDSSGGSLEMTRKMYTAAQCKACLRIRGIHASDVYTRKYEAVNVFYRIACFVLCNCGPAGRLEATVDQFFKCMRLCLAVYDPTSNDNPTVYLAIV
ncbi:hypothetical protein TWF751_010317 [Orbilia oligospora]|nr:hypothetical protein TWF751_010317 [Orbilia oligospora]